MSTLFERGFDGSGGSFGSEFLSALIRQIRLIRVQEDADAEDTL